MSYQVRQLLRFNQEGLIHFQVTFLQSKHKTRSLLSAEKRKKVMLEATSAKTSLLSMKTLTKFRREHQ